MDLKVSLVDIHHVSIKGIQIVQIADNYVVSFAGLGYLAFYLAGKMHVFDKGGVSYNKSGGNIPDVLPFLF